MRLLLDTHIALWMVLDDPKMPSAARVAIDSASAIVVSGASIWELAIKKAAGRFDVDIARLVRQLEAAGAEHLAVTWQHGLFVADLPLHHRDPFDRILVAQAAVAQLRLLTHDGALARYGDFVHVV